MQKINSSSTRRRSSTSLLLRYSLMIVAMIVTLTFGERAFAQATLSSHQRTSAQRESEFKELTKQASFIEQQYRQVKRIAKFVRPTVVHIDAKKRESEPLSRSGKSKKDLRPVIIEEAGSGVIIERNRRQFVLTNYHVIEDSQLNDIRLEADGQVFYPINVMHDRHTDIAVLEIDEYGLIAARMGDSRNVEVGDFAVAVGSPFGLSHSVSYGIISALGRHNLKLGPQGGKYQNFIQTDAAINPGNSGGPLINLRGEVIGINTAIASNSGGSDGIGFAIPINMVMRIASDLIDRGFVRRGFLGVSLDAMYSPSKARAIGLRRTHGAMISSISENSPASKSELRVGDVILEFNDRHINDDAHLVTTVSLTDINSSVPVKVFR
ncbi:trypsin-like peptidase domain-containing protein, partial [bacterium]|nr:trypsin-like peptidase domain-containing protein [bacterium]